MTFFNLVTRDNQHAIDLFFIILSRKPHVWLNWEDYYSANKYIFLGLKSVESRKLQVGVERFKINLSNMKC